MKPVFDVPTDSYLGRYTAASDDAGRMQLCSELAMAGVLADVRAFHQACDIPILPAPAIPDRDRVDLRERLLTEEFDEFMRASAAGDLVEVADALADIIYICAGTALEYGIPLDRVWAEVQRSNMAKVRGGVRRNEFGKVLKPADWTPPNVAAALGVDNTHLEA